MADAGLHADTDPVKHMRLAAVLGSQPLAGESQIASWRDRAGTPTGWSRSWSSRRWTRPCWRAGRPAKP